jgi:hypothetical protein
LTALAADTQAELAFTSTLLLRTPKNYQLWCVSLSVSLCLRSCVCVCVCAALVLTDAWVRVGTTGRCWWTGLGRVRASRPLWRAFSLKTGKTTTRGHTGTPPHLPLLLCFGRVFRLMSAPMRSLLCTLSCVGLFVCVCVSLCACEASLSLSVYVRLWLLGRFPVLWASELDYVDGMLLSDVRNNSAWSHRYTMHTRGPDALRIRPAVDVPPTPAEDARLHSEVQYALLSEPHGSPARPSHAHAVLAYVFACVCACTVMS